MRRILVLVFTAVFLISAAPLAASEESRLMRYPDIHGDRIVFTYGGDIWTVPSKGGMARRLTSDVGGEAFAKFSPDGETIAFSASYDGNPDIYIIPARGGTPKRLTYHPLGDMMLDWHPSGDFILMRSARKSKTNPGPRYNRLFTVSRDGGYPEVLPLFEGELTSYSPDGNKIAYNRISREFRTWKRYRGGMAQDIWIYDLKNNKSEKLTEFGGTDAFPMWHGNSVYFISDREDIMNIYKIDLGTREIVKVTDHDRYDVKFPSLGGDAIVYENGGYLYVLDLNTGKTAKITVNIPAELNQKRPHYVDAGRLIRSFGISAAGKRAAFGARGDIFTVPAEKGEIRNLTASSGSRDRSPAFSPNGKWVAYFSDRDGEYEIYLQKPDGSGEAKRLTRGVKNYPFDLLWSPDSRKLLYHDQTFSLYCVDAEDGRITRIAQDDWGDITDYAWSPRSDWVTYIKRGDNGYGSVYVYSVKSGKSTRITDDFYRDFDPVFSADGKYIFFLSDRMLNFKLGGTNEFNFLFDMNTNLCAVSLQKDVPSLLAPESDEVEVKEEEDKDGKEEDGDKKEEEEKGLEIDFDGIDSRIVALPVGTGNFAGLVPLEQKVLFAEFSVPLVGTKGKASAALKYYDIKEREVKTVIAGISGYDISADGKKVLYSAMGGKYGIIDIQPGKNVGDGSIKTALETKICPSREWEQMFNEAWRMERDFFYVENMHGVDWKDIKKKYELFLPYLTSRNDLNYVIGEMIAELNVGHAYVGGGDRPRGERIGVGLLGADFEVDKDRYRFARIYEGRNWDDRYLAPLVQPGIDVNEGDYLIAVNGREVKYPENVYSFFENLAGKQVQIRVADNPGGEDAREFAVVPTSSDLFLRYHNWVESNRRKVLEKSDGRIGYFHVPNTNVWGLQEFARGYYPQAHKDGIIVDERYNSGGWIPTIFVERLGRKVTSMWAQRYGKPGKFPRSASEGHLAMLINQYSGSGGDAFPYYFRQAGLGPLIGKRTWGGLVGMNRNLPLMDGGMVTVPTIGFYEMSGEWGIENIGVYPDIEVEILPEEGARGEDPQLDRAIRYLLDKIREDKPELPETPDAPEKD
ncbi:MAG: PDZ domain-containing protein [Candidatus Krumholzibacteriales bacterium]